MDYKALDFVTIRETDTPGRVRVVVDPQHLYPRTVNYIQWLLEQLPGDWFALSDMNRILFALHIGMNPILIANTYAIARLPERAWTYALQAVQGFDETSDVGRERLQLRALALDTALGFFMRALRAEMAGQPYDTTITRDPAYRLKA